MHPKIRGVALSFLAAISNSTLGIFNRFCFEHSIDAISIAFYRCFIASIIIFVVLVVQNHFISSIRSHTKRDIAKIIFLSFFGIFLLYIFETKAFSYSKISTVSLTVYAMGFVTLIVSIFLLKERLTHRKFLCVLLLILGQLFVIGEIPNFENESLRPILYAAVGGTGYSLFIVFVKKFQIKSSLIFLFFLTFFGGALIFMYMVFTGQYPQNPIKIIFPLLFLTIFPTLLGSYFTAAALKSLEAGYVQIIEMSDPLFAMLLAYFFFSDTFFINEMIGAVFIILGLALTINHKKKGEKNVYSNS